MTQHIYRGPSSAFTKGKHYPVLDTDSDPCRDGRDYVFVQDDIGRGRWVDAKHFEEVKSCKS